MSHPSYAAAVAAVAAVAAATAIEPCRILDDEELEKPPVFRNWRETTTTLSAQRIFGGASTGSGQRAFPSAFQSYRQERGDGGSGGSGGGGFPFQSRRGRQARPSQRQGDLQRRVRGALDMSGTFMGCPPSPLLAQSESLEDVYAYAAATPSYSPKTPPWWDASGNLMTGTAVPPPFELDGEPRQN